MTLNASPVEKTCLQNAETTHIDVSQVQPNRVASRVVAVVGHVDDGQRDEAFPERIGQR